MQYVTRLRVREAQRLLRETDLPVATISTMVGFDDPLYFSRRFRQLVGDAPRVWRRTVQSRDIS
jgi:transcriptional regulator GlxA family with amidase domain